MPPDASTNTLGRRTSTRIASQDTNAAAQATAPAATAPKKRGSPAKKAAPPPATPAPPAPPSWTPTRMRLEEDVEILRLAVGDVQQGLVSNSQDLLETNQSVSEIKSMVHSLSKNINILNMTLQSDLAEVIDDIRSNQQRDNTAIASLTARLRDVEATGSPASEAPPAKRQRVEDAPSIAAAAAAPLAPAVASAPQAASSAAALAPVAPAPAVPAPTAHVAQAVPLAAPATHHVMPVAAPANLAPVAPPLHPAPAAPPQLPVMDTTPAPPPAPPALPALGSTVDTAYAAVPPISGIQPAQAWGPSPWAAQPAPRMSPYPPTAIRRNTNNRVYTHVQFGPADWGHGDPLVAIRHAIERMVRHGSTMGGLIKTAQLNPNDTRYLVATFWSLAQAQNVANAWNDDRSGDAANVTATVMQGN
ncbi:hypothetical protein DFP72DRAFT_903365 [Ephemerocybe angulata]|uniref:Uncharacterized protein n=1 Tax=Ephemerocybe angulata TaxID=980116 RepID=A0A8H6HVL2_9AGAR|nr:hypothetical protein DFP72DRAFT_903365 [Tulosesus angulatus]